MLFTENILGGIRSTIIKRSGTLLSFLPLLLSPFKEKKKKINPTPQ